MSRHLIKTFIVLVAMLSMVVGTTAKPKVEFMDNETVFSGKTFYYQETIDFKIYSELPDSTLFTIYIHDKNTGVTNVLSEGNHGDFNTDSKEIQVTYTFINSDMLSHKLFLTMDIKNPITVPEGIEKRDTSGVFYLEMGTVEPNKPVNTTVYHETPFEINLQTTNIFTDVEIVLCPSSDILTEQPLYIGNNKTINIKDTITDYSYYTQNLDFTIRVYESNNGERGLLYYISDPVQVLLGSIDDVFIQNRETQAKVKDTIYLNSVYDLIIDGVMNVDKINIYLCDVESSDTTLLKPDSISCIDGHASTFFRLSGRVHEGRNYTIMATYLNKINGEYHALMMSEPFNVKYYKPYFEFKEIDGVLISKSHTVKWDSKGFADDDKLELYLWNVDSIGNNIQGTDIELTGKNTLFIGEGDTGFEIKKTFLDVGEYRLEGWGHSFYGDTAFLLNRSNIFKVDEYECQEYVDSNKTLRDSIETLNKTIVELQIIGSDTIYVVYDPYTGIENEYSSKLFDNKIYPNPAEGDEVTIITHSSETIINTVTVWSIDGVQIKHTLMNEHTEAGSKEYKLDISDYPSGVWFIEIKQSGWKPDLYKLIIER